jgi:hypothetical protein
MHRILLYMILLLPVHALAQYSFNGNITSSVNIQNVMVLSVTSNAATVVTLNNTQYSNGYTMANFNTFNIKSNVPWRLSVASATPYFSASGTYASTNMPASVIGVAKSGQPFVKLTTTPQLLASGNRGNSAKTGNSFNMDFQATPGYNYGPGIYTITLLYTLTAQ